MQLSGAKVEVAESVSSPAGAEKLRILKAVKGFEGIVTDADGKAVINGLKPQYFVVVSDERQIGENTEEHLWIVAASEAHDEKLLLDADNLAPTEALETTWLLTPSTIDAMDWGMMHWEWAITNGNKDMVELLIVNGADVNAKTSPNWSTPDWTPLHFAASSGKKDIAELLLAKGANVNAKTGMEMTPLHYAVANGHKDIAELLLAKGADVNAKDLRGGGATPLHYAVGHGYKDIAELLLANGANVNAESHGGTPLRVAIEQAHSDDIADLLRAHGGKE